MTEKRYFDGTLAKWYYSRTNVISDGDNEYYLRNKESIKDWEYNELLGTNDLLDELNRLSDENEQLKQDREKLFIRERDTKNEWRKLKQENERLRKALDEGDDLIKSHLSSHYNRKWENYLEYLGVDLK